MDLEGKLIIKVRLEDDVRVIPIHNEEITYDELQLMMQRIFRGKLEAEDEVVIKYRDEDGDMITIFDSNDLALAIAMSRLLKLTLFLKPKLKELDYEDVWKIRKSLKSMRATLDSLLQRLELIEPPNNSDDEATRAAGDGEKVDVEDVPAVRTICSKEFDPLEQGERAVTSSIGNGLEDGMQIPRSSPLGGKPSTKPAYGGPPQPMVNGGHMTPALVPQHLSQAQQRQEIQIQNQHYAVGMGAMGQGQPPMSAAQQMSMASASSTTSLPQHPVPSVVPPTSGGYYQHPQGPQGPGMPTHPGQQRPGMPQQMGPQPGYQGAPQQQQQQPPMSPYQPGPRGPPMPPPPAGASYPGHPHPHPQQMQQGPQQQQPMPPMNYQQVTQQQQQRPPQPQQQQQGYNQPHPGAAATSSAPPPSSSAPTSAAGVLPTYYNPSSQMPPQSAAQQPTHPVSGASPVPTSLGPPTGNAPPPATPPMGPPILPTGAVRNPFSARAAAQAYPRPSYPGYQ